MKVPIGAGLAFASAVTGVAIPIPQFSDSGSSLAGCPGYSASNVRKSGTGMTADLTLAGEACNVYGTDIHDLRLLVNYDAAKRLHVKIEDAGQEAYQVPTSVFPTPSSSNSVSADESELEFSYEMSPFSFKVVRKSNGEVLFDTGAAPMVFEDQYLRLRTSLPNNPNLYGLGEHSDPFRLNTTDYTRTLWSRDSFGIPTGTNLYGNHPIYFDHRGASGTHGVFLLSSAGMDVKVNRTAADGQYLEYNLISGIFDFYFINGPSPTEVAEQYSSVVGKAAMMPYWGFGFHQCRFGYRDFYAIAEVIYNYSTAGIPLETMWTDIDYMFERLIMTTDPDRFPIPRVRDIVSYLHEHNQQYIVMVDPAVGYREVRENGLPYQTFLRGVDRGIFLFKNGSLYQGVVWPGVTVFPDWFHPDAQDYWNDEFAEFFDPETGIDIDALWIDMNEAANFNIFGDNPQEAAEESGFPPARPPLRSAPRPIPGFPQEFQPDPNSPYPPDSQGYAAPWLAVGASPTDDKRDLSANSKPGIVKKQAPADIIGFEGRNLLAPPYQIDNENTVEAFGGLSNFTLDTDIIHYDGHVELDAHNLYGTMMSTVSRNAMENRRPGRRPMVITRSTFAGAGAQVGKWLGDNLSTWEQYRQSIQGMLDFAAHFQIPMVGSDVCGFGGNTTEMLCARWATLGAFNPFYRNHNIDSGLPQEFFVWTSVAEAAKNAIDIRYRLLDYIYTALHRQHKDGTPLINPMYFLYPTDSNTFGNQLQFFYGNALLVSPVTEENSTSVTFYLPKDIFYDFNTFAPVQGQGASITLSDIPFTDIPLHIRGGTIIPMRSASGYTTTDVRKQPFNIVIAPGANSRATGELYLDDGDSIVQAATSEIQMSYAEGTLEVSGTFGYQAEGNRIASVTLLGVQRRPEGAHKDSGWSYDHGSQSVTVRVDRKLDGKFSIKI